MEISQPWNLDIQRDNYFHTFRFVIKMNLKKINYSVEKSKKVYNLSISSEKTKITLWRASRLLIPLLVLR